MEIEIKQQKCSVIVVISHDIDSETNQTTADCIISVIYLPNMFYIYVYNNF